MTFLLLSPQAREIAASLLDRPLPERRRILSRAFEIARDRDARKIEAEDIHEAIRQERP
jgi:ATP-dependent DNA ligase